MTEIKFSSVLNNRNILSPSNYSSFDILASKKYPLRDLIDGIDKGIEIGSTNYVEKSDYKFIRTAAFTDYKCSIVEDENSVLPISKLAFIDMNLKQNDLLIVKDSNVGEAVLLDRDYPSYMYSSGINRIKISKDKYYIYAVIKNDKFKEQLFSKIPKGATIMHAKDLYLVCIIPYPNSRKVVEYVESLIKIIINKENELKNKITKINEIVLTELNYSNWTKDNNVKYPKISQLMQINRLDTGNYTEEFSVIDNNIKNYYNGCFYISEDCISGGNTPKQRYISDNKNLKYYWIVPSYIYDDGTIDLSYKIDCDKNNINENCMLIINRTSKGGLGEYVGISSYYDYGINGKAQHNQGIYRVRDNNDKKLIFMTCLMNSKIYRKYCANLSMGSKMKELKLNNILSIPFPNFPENVVSNICSLYYNQLIKGESTSEQFEIDNKNWDDRAGVLDLFSSIQKTKEKLNDIIENIYNNKGIDITYKIF